MSIRNEMPLLARHEGQWEGVYIHVDPQGAIVDQHKSLLTCTFPDSGPFDYFQTNVYTWDNGKQESLTFPALYRDKRIWWDNERITGSAWEIDQKTIMLTWTRKDLAGSSLYEMIQLSDNGIHRARTWHWFENDILVKRTLIKEEKLP